LLAPPTRKSERAAWTGREKKKLKQHASVPKRVDHLQGAGGFGLRAKWGSKPTMTAVLCD